MSDSDTKTVRVLGLVGSPRKGGNTDLLIDEVLSAAEQKGASVEKIYLSKKDIAPCRACNACRKLGKCSVEDDMVGMVEKMNATDVWVIGTPVYYWGPTGWLKAFIDRWYGIGKQVQFKDKRAVIVVPMEDTNMATARHTVGMLTDTLDYVKTGLVATVVAAGVLNRGDVAAKDDILREARMAGEKAVSALLN
ncbi:MAG: flavodoxin family protein [candidate division Zixibacteria bacterium]